MTTPLEDEKHSPTDLDGSQADMAALRLKDQVVSMRQEVRELEEHRRELETYFSRIEDSVRSPPEYWSVAGNSARS